MKKILVFPLFIFLLMASAQAADPVKVASEIQSVMVYRQGAEVQRNGEAKVKPGVNELVFEGVSAGLDPRSISLQGDAAVTILSVSFRNNTSLKAPQTPDQQRAQTLLDTQNLRLELIQNERWALEEEMRMLMENKRVNANKGTYAEELEDAAELYHNMILMLKNRLIEMRRRETAQKELVTEAQRQLAESSRGLNRSTGEITVSVQSSSYATVKFQLSYFCPQAGWRPMYSLRATALNEAIKLEYDALVQQRTGEDWKNVNIALSTGNPSTSGNLPEYRVLRLQRPAPTGYDRRAGKKDAAGQGTYAPAEGYYDNTNDELSYASDKTTAQSSLLSMVFEINLKYDIAADGQEKFIRIQRNEVKANFRFVTYPRIDQSAYLVAYITDWEGLNLLPGESNIFYQGSFVGKSFINPEITEDTLKVSFGPDNDIHVKRTRITESKKKQFLGSDITETFEWAITVRNAKSSGISLVVIDQVPLSAEPNIEISLKERDGATYTAPDGKLRWELNIAPAETRVLKFTYTIKYPQGIRLEFNEGGLPPVYYYKK